MCTFNGAKYIDEQLQSLCQQTKQPYEIIICDDGSSDATEVIVNKYIATVDFPIRFEVNKDRLGYRRNFTQAASLCSGDLVAFCDQDDIWRSDKLSKVADWFSDPRIMMVHHNARVVDANAVPSGFVNKAGHHPVLAKPLQENPWSYSLGFTQTFRSELIKFGDLRSRIMGEEETEWTAHDQWISFLSSSLGWVAYIDEELVDYRQHGANAYGIKISSKKTGRFSSLLAKLGAYRDYNKLSEFSKRRARVLDEIMGRVDVESEIYERAKIAKYFYNDLAKVYEMRGKIYSDKSIISRFLAWQRMISDGKYGKSDIAFSPVSLGRDFVQGVVMAKLRSATAPTADFSLRLRT